MVRGWHQVCMAWCARSSDLSVMDSRAYDRGGYEVYRVRGWGRARGLGGSRVRRKGAGEPDAPLRPESPDAAIEGAGVPASGEVEPDESASPSEQDGRQSYSLSALGRRRL